MKQHWCKPGKWYADLPNGLFKMWMLVSGEWRVAGTVFNYRRNGFSVFLAKMTTPSLIRMTRIGRRTLIMRDKWQFALNFRKKVTNDNNDSRGIPPVIETYSQARYGRRFRVLGARNRGRGR